MSFAKHVSYETVWRALFNYWEPSRQIRVNGRDYISYVTVYPRPKLNMVVVEALEDREELYFRTFLGKPPEESETQEETERFWEDVGKAVDPKYRVPGPELEARIIAVLEELEAGMLPHAVG
jgi:hypothetical protein